MCLIFLKHLAESILDHKIKENCFQLCSINGSSKHQDPSASSGLTSPDLIDNIRSKVSCRSDIKDYDFTNLVKKIGEKIFKN